MINKKLFMFFLFIMLIFLNADQMVLSPNIGLVQKEFNVNDADIGLLASTFTILGAVISLVWGYLADKYSRKNLLIYSILVGEIPAFMSAFSRSFGELFLWRTLTGIGVGASFPIAYSLIGDLYGRRERARAASLLMVSVTIGSIVGMLVGGYTGPLWGWRVPFILVSVPNFIFAALAIFLITEPKRGITEDEIADLIESGAYYPRKPKLSDYVKILKIKTNLFLFLQGIAGTIPWGAIPYYMVEFFRRERGISISTATTIFLFFAIGSVLGTLSGGWIGEKLYKIKKELVSYFMGFTTIGGVVATVAVLRYRPEGPWGIFWLSLFGTLSAMLLSMTGPNTRMFVLNVNEPVDRGRIFSIFNLTDSLGTGIGKYFGGSMAVVLGSLGKALELSAYFWVVCGILLLMTAFHIEKEARQLMEKLKVMRKAIEER